MTASTVMAAVDVRVYYELARVAVMDQWWHWLALLVALACIVAFVIFFYRRDNVELPRGVGWLLITLRLLTVAVLLLFFLDLQKRSEQRIVKNSRAVLLVDTSQSMALRDEEDAAGNRLARMDVITPQLPDLVATLRQNHDVVLYQFDEQERPSQMGRFPKYAAPSASQPTVTESGANRTARARTLARTTLALMAMAVAMTGAHLGLRWRSRDRQCLVLYGASLLFLASIAAWAFGDIRFGTLRGDQPDAVDRSTPERPQNDTTTGPGESKPAGATEPEADWTRALNPHGTHTRIGDALMTIIDRERGGPISGIALFTDGNQNQGAPITEAAALAREARIPIFPVGVGSDQSPANVRIAELEVPARVYPGDAFPTRVYLQATGMDGQSVRVELLKVDAVNPENLQAAQRVDEKFVRLGADGETTVVQFELQPTAPGRQTYVARVTSTTEDTDPQDNVRRASVVVVDRRNRVLLFAGGPSREYQFLRVQLFRDQEVEVDVYLQNSLKGAAQEADQVLSEFPATLAELSRYDCVVAFDPNWSALTDEQTSVLDRWVAEQAGGLIVVAGPVYTPEWTTAVRERQAIRTVKALYPVSFFRRGTFLGRDRYATADALPVHLTPEGAASPFLRLSDDPATALSAWDDFPGVYGNFPIRGIKPGTTVLAVLGDQASDDASNTFMATQFYGAGRVLYLGSGELWRLRALDPAYFEMLYTRLVRYVSEGRLLQDSDRGVLLVDRDRCLIGDTVQVRAILRDEQFRPLSAPFVEATLKGPAGDSQPLRLMPVRDTVREGTYVGQFVAKADGDYQIQLSLASAAGLDILYRDLQARMPDVETTSPQRNDPVLSELAATTSGQYLIRPKQPEWAQSLPTLLPPRDQETYIPGTPDRAFRTRLLRWLMTILCGCLCWEWLARRWNRLA